MKMKENKDKRIDGRKAKTKQQKRINKREVINKRKAR